MTVGYVRTNELDPFVKRVNQLRAEGLSTRDIARRLDIPVSTMNERLRKHREQQHDAQQGDGTVRTADSNDRFDRAAS